MKKLSVFIPILLLLTACSKTPMEKLQSDKIYPEMSQEFWLSQFKQKTPLWRTAVEYCIANGDKPNCKIVNDIYVCGGDCSRKSPPMGTTGEDINLKG